MHAITIRRALVSTIGAVAIIAGSLGVLASASAAPVSSGLAAAVDPDKNQPAYWVDFLEDMGYTDVECTKFEFPPNEEPFTVPAPKAGFDWVLAVIKAGSGDEANQLVWNPSEDDVLKRTDGKDISHVILCQAPTKTSTTTTTTTTKTTTSSTSPSTGPVVETDVTGGSNSFGMVAGLAVLLGGIALTIGGLRRPVRKH